MIIKEKKNCNIQPLLFEYIFLVFCMFLFIISLNFNVSFCAEMKKKCNCLVVQWSYKSLMLCKKIDRHG